jgi:hypothetical protein
VARPDWLELRENWEELKALPREILEAWKQVQRMLEKALAPDEVEWEEFLGPSLEPSLERFTYEKLRYLGVGSAIAYVLLTYCRAKG